MPNLDETGPNGKGPMTGRGKGRAIKDEPVDVYTVSYEHNGKTKYLNIPADSEEEARKFFETEVMKIFYEKYLGENQIESRERHSMRFKFLTANKNIVYSKN